MYQGIKWLVESLESRRMLSHHSTIVDAPAPKTTTPTPTVSVKRRHHTAAAAPGVFQVAGGLGGIWAGGLQAPGSASPGAVSLSVFLYGSAESYAILTFTRPGGQVVKNQSQFVVSSAGRFSMQVINGKFAMRFSGMIFNHMTRTSSVATMNGNLQYWDRAGMYKADVAISRA